MELTRLAISPRLTLRSVPIAQVVQADYLVLAEEPDSEANQAEQPNLNTPAEALEYAYPVRLRQYSFRSNSGGAGLHSGGDGIVREIEVLTDAQVTLLADRRSRGPYGLAGGNDGAPGRTMIIRRDGSEETIPGKTSIRLRSGERVRIESPGGGGWGKRNL